MAGCAAVQFSSSSDRDRQRWDNQLCILQLSSSFRGDSAFVIQFIISQFFPCAPPDNDWQGFVVQSARSSQSIKQLRLMDRQAGSRVSVPFQRTEQSAARMNCHWWWARSSFLNIYCRSICPQTTSWSAFRGIYECVMARAEPYINCQCCCCCCSGRQPRRA